MLIDIGIGFVNQAYPIGGQKPDTETQHTHVLPGHGIGEPFS